MELPEGVRRERIEPLWSRVDRNRVKFALFIAGYLFSIAASAALLAAILGLILGPMLVRGAITPADLVAQMWRIVGMAAALALAAGSAWVAWVMLRSEKRLMGKLGALLTPTGHFRTTKLALKDMALAAGFEHAPPLWVIPDCTRVNAFAVGRTHRTALMGVTQGFADKLSAADQRAVFANLMARLTNDDVRWATAVSALVGPIWRMRDADLRREPDFLIPEDDGEGPGGKKDSDRAVGEFLYFVLYVFVIVITELLLAGHQRQTMLTAEKADAEGMLLLKDPHEMLHALATVLEADNTVPTAGEAYSGLFYCWAGFGFAPDDDPEFERLARLREVLGVEGLVDPTRIPMPEHPEALLSPPAPRIDKTGSGL
jgi:Zn-dependent protease with chaperone function